MRIAQLTVAFVILVALVRAAGGLSPNPLRRMFSAATLPDGQFLTCWHDICPGQTTADEAVRILQTDSSLQIPKPENYPSCWESRIPSYIVCLDLDGDFLANIYIGSTIDFGGNLNPDSQLLPRLGDVVSLWGNPVSVSPPNCGGSSINFGRNMSVYVLWTSSQGDAYRLDPAFPGVMGFTLFASGQIEGYDAPWPWKGFVKTSERICAGD